MSLTHKAGIVVKGTTHNQSIFFFVANITDVIQNCHLNGAFYEPEELAIVARHFRRGQVFLDIGANVGNHAIYVEKFLAPQSVIAIEPNPEAVTILRINARLNALAKLDRSLLGIGLSDADGSAIVQYPANNLGGARLQARTDGGIRVTTGDALLAGRHVDFAKIDVEGLEMAVLRGLRETIARCRPTIFIEVDNTHTGEFAQWLATNSYKPVERFRRYASNQNFLVTPAEKAT